MIYSYVRVRVCVRVCVCGERDRERKYTLISLILMKSMMVIGQKHFLRRMKFDNIYLITT